MSDNAPWCDPSEWMTDSASSAGANKPVPLTGVISPEEWDRLVRNGSTHSVVLSRQLPAGAFVAGKPLPRWASLKAECLRRSRPDEVLEPGTYFLMRIDAMNTACKKPTFRVVGKINPETGFAEKYPKNS